MENSANGPPEPRGDSRRTLLCADVPLLEYTDAWRLQVGLAAARKSPRLDSDVFLLLEHPPVFTLGRRGGRENLTVPESFLEKSGIPVFHVERGGNITYHGPGQLVGYPVMHLQAAGLSVTGYVEGLEEVMIRTAARWGVACGRNPLNRGVWVGRSKLGSIGVAVRRGITFHGFAFNVNLDLEPFHWINPCGLKGIGVTSLQKELGHPLPMAEVRRSLKESFETVFGAALAPVELEDLRRFAEDPGDPEGPPRCG
ncbi:MAG: lipoyl(octanoyl) transferase LipB [Desulfobacteraceae bacterium]|nr:lipoyl(octanoyl) transferase LipB [Desulfobacteraceae bacterium]